MPRAKTTKLYRTFVKGLITEAGYLTYPEDASSGELNTVLSRKGNRTRRLGINFEDQFQLKEIVNGDQDRINEYVWRSVANIGGLNFLVVQVGPKLHFFGLEASPVSDSEKSFTVNLSDYKVATASERDIAEQTAEFSSGRGYLFVVHEYMEPLIIEYSDLTDSITVTPIVIQIRDFEGVYDGLANDQEPTTLSAEHHYNLVNQGWMSPGSKGVSLPGTTNPGYNDPYTGEAVVYERDGNGRFLQENEMIP